MEQTRLVQLRNPWGKSNDGPRWKGAFSRLNSNGEWTPMLREIVRPRLDANDGTFWMALSDFQCYFRSASLCHLVCLDPSFKICRLSSRIVYDYDAVHNSESVSFPKLILDLSASGGGANGGGVGVDEMTLEWIGMQQENLRSQYAIHHEYLDCCGVFHVHCVAML